jgi:hypothetical protein
MCERQWYVAHQASRCCAAKSADAREFGSAMEVMQKVVIWRFEQVVSCDDTTEEWGMGYECFSNTLDYQL